MPEITIQHNAIVNNWPGPEEVKNPKVLVLGSFNPHNPNDQNTEYYYGRESNYFWKAIAYIEMISNDNPFQIEDTSHFQDLLNRKIEVMKLRSFVCLDVIDKVCYYNDSEDLCSQFVEHEVLTGYEDSTIFTSKVKEREYGISSRIERTYNKNVHSFLRKYPKQIRVIHTMGNNRFLTDFRGTPIENNKGDAGFGDFGSEVNRLSREFVLDSKSPSGRMIPNEEHENFFELVKWLKHHIYS
ncbi:MAG: hypothetical protein JXR10_06945 [Cyclobacteriaceae bacterium]